MGIATDNMVPFYLKLWLCKEPKSYRDHWKIILMAYLLMTTEYFSQVSAPFLEQQLIRHYLHPWNQKLDLFRNSILSTLSKLFYWIKLVSVDYIFSSIIFCKVWPTLIWMSYSQSDAFGEAQILLAFSDPTRQNWLVFPRAPKELLIIVLYGIMLWYDICYYSVLYSNPL